MAAVLIAILSMIVIGIPIALAIDPSARGLLLLGLAFLYGTGWIFFAMLALAVLHVHWTIVMVTIAALGPMLLLLRTGHGARATAHFKLHWLDLATLTELIGFTIFATSAALWEWDFWAIWGMKARQFLEVAGIDWRFLESPWNTYAHPDYPLLVPLNFDFVAVLNGGWSDRWLGFLFVAWAAAVLLIVRDLAAREASIVPAALITFAVTGLAASRYPGLAEGPMIAFGSAGVLFIRRALRFDDSIAWRHGALLLGLAANTKNEGLALLVAVAASLLVVGPRSILRLWPAAALAAPWLILRAVHTLPTDIVGGSAFSRVLARLPNSGMILLYILGHLNEAWFWILILIGAMIVPLAFRRSERFIFLVTGIQLVFYIGSYYATPHDLRWHVATSWSRLTDQIAIPIGFAVFLSLARYAAGDDTNRTISERTSSS